MSSYNLLEFNDFELNLRNRERILISELSLDRISDLDVKKHLVEKPVLRVPSISREAIDAAIRGYDSQFTKQLSSPPHVVLAKLGPIHCALRDKCSNYESNICRLNASLRSEPIFPICYEYHSEDPIERFIMTEFSRKWREKRTVIICPD
jgi:hypothetical protein